MGYLSISQIAEKWKISGRRMQRLCAEGRIPGATKIGYHWAVPDDAEKSKMRESRAGSTLRKVL